MSGDLDQPATDASGLPASLHGSDPARDQSADLPTPTAVLPPAMLHQPPPLAGRPAEIRSWFDGAVLAAVPVHDGTLETARVAAQAYARHAKADNTRRAYRAGVRAWCEWCHHHALPCLPANPADVVAFLAAERGRGLSVTTVELRRAAIRYLHFIAGCAVPTAEAQVAETVSGMRRHAADQGELPARKLAATADLLRDILRIMPDDLAGLRDRALLLLGFAGALRRAELAAVHVAHLETRERGLRLTLPRSKGERTGRVVTVAIPYGRTELCPVRAIRRWQAAAGIADGALFRRIWLPPSAGGGPPPCPRVGTEAIDPGTVGRIIKKRATAAGFDGELFGGHSLKRGALTTGMDQGVHPTRLKQLGRHKSYAVLDDYLQFGDPFEGHPLAGVL